MNRTRTRRTATVLAAAAGAALVLAGAATAEKPVVRYSAADQALAKAVVLKRADLGAGWKGGAKRPQIEDPAEDCPGWNPKQADLVVTGAAKSEFEQRASALSVTTSVYLLETAEMVRLDWRRTVSTAAALRCIREGLERESDRTTQFVSAKRTPFPKLGATTTRIRTIVNYVSGKTKVPVMVDLVAIAKGRTELSLTVGAPLAARGAVERFEVELARLLLGRVRA